MSEEARIVADMAAEGLSQREISKRTGLSRRMVKQMLTAAEASEEGEAPLVAAAVSGRDRMQMHLVKSACPTCGFAYRASVQAWKGGVSASALVCAFCVVRVG